jgi:hypothetical protein
MGHGHQRTIGVNGRARLFVYGVSAEAWADYHRIQIFSHPCSECGRMLTVSRPFAQGTLRGLAAPPCECGNERTPYGMVRAEKYGDLFTGVEVPRRRGVKKRKACPVIHLPRRQLVSRSVDDID